jgi:ATP-binding cassette subfamily F protein 3
MTSLLQVQGGRKELGNRLLFSNLSFAVNEGEHIGVIGPNGAGKTTLFRILARELTLDQGSLTNAKKLRLGYLRQQTQRDPSLRVLDLMTREYSVPEWRWLEKAPSFGLGPTELGATWGSLSGGYRMRVELLALEMQEPNLLLLDEPTNYLDLESVLFLEAYLSDYSGAFLLISHDREFLRKTSDHVLEIESGEATKFNGNLDDYFEQKQWLRANLEAQARSQSEKRAAILEFVARFGAKATKARQAQSRLKQLERMEPISIRPIPNASRFRIVAPDRQPKEPIRMDGVSLGYKERAVINGADWTLGRGEHWGVVGYNGAGKSTFLKSVAGELPLLSGTRTLSEGLKIGYFSQHVAEALNPDRTIYETLAGAAHASVSQQDVLNMAGSMLFSGDDVYKKIRVLSGGEKTRVGLAKILLSRAHVLILDEPTNHLDFASVDALGDALDSYEGSFVVVSHDRSFIQRVAKKIIEVSNGVLRTYAGSYEDYVWSVARGVYAVLQKPAEEVSKKLQPSSPAPSSSGLSSQSLDKAIRKIESRISAVDKNLADCLSKGLFEDWSKLNNEKASLEVEWEALMLERESLKGS